MKLQVANLSRIERSRLQRLERIWQASVLLSQYVMSEGKLFDEKTYDTKYIIEIFMLCRTLNLNWD
jgi:hypothetical protein